MGSRFRVDFLDNVTRRQEPTNNSLGFYGFDVTPEGVLNNTSPPCLVSYDGSPSYAVNVHD